jgi:hypothetical protein
MNELITGQLINVNNSSKWMSRKFWATMFWQLVMVVLLYKQILPAQIFENLTYLLVGGYLLANVTQRYVEKPKNEQTN